VGVDTRTVLLAGWRTEQDCTDALDDAGIVFIAFNPMFDSAPVFVGEVLAEFSQFADSVIVPLAHPLPDPGPRPPVGDGWEPGVWFIGHYT